jgi:hypothetical protein
MIKTKPFDKSQLAGLSGQGMKPGASTTGSNGFSLYVDVPGTLTGQDWVNWAATHDIPIKDAEDYTLAISKTLHQPLGWFKTA